MASETASQRAPRAVHERANGKVPIWFDSRLGSIEKSKHLKLCAYMARVSTLRRSVKLTIPLNPAKYHLDLLQRGTLKSFQLVKRHGKYYVHVKVEYAVPSQPTYAIRGMDLGVKRSLTSVMLRPNQPLRRSDFSIQTDGVRPDHLNRIEKWTAELQHARKSEPLKRHKKLHLTLQRMKSLDACFFMLRTPSTVGCSISEAEAMPVACYR